MKKVVLDKTTLTKLNPISEILEVFDESGKLLGHYLPLDKPAGLLQAIRSCPYSEEELQQFEQETGGRPLAEIWKSLGRTS